MKLLCDHNVAVSTVEFLRGQGHEAERTVNLLGARATDPEIIAAARAGGWIIVTHDLDFGTLRALSDEPLPSVITLRLRSAALEIVHPALLRAIEATAEELMRGAHVVVEDTRMRVRSAHAAH